MSQIAEFSEGCRLLLSRRFCGLLDRIDGSSRKLTRREIYHLGDFVEYMGLGRWTDAAASLRRAEQMDPIPEPAAHLVETNHFVSTAEFRHLLRGTIDRD